MTTRDTTITPKARLRPDARAPISGGVRRRVLAGMPVDDRRLELAGISTAVLEGGDGPPLVLVHGQGEFAATWGRVVPALVETHRVIAPDLPGHGASATGTGKLDAARVLSWLGELVEETCPSPPILVGHLLGGAIAARFASDRSNRLERLVLVDTLGLARYRPSPAFALAMMRFLARPTERSRDRLFGRCFVDFDGLRDEMGDAWEPLGAYALERVRAPGTRTAVRRLISALGSRPIPASELARITAPTSLIWGRHDLQVPVRVGESASARYGWPLTVVDGAADDPAVEQPDAFVRALRAALDPR